MVRFAEYLRGADFADGGNGFGIFLLRQYFMTVPVELEEAAMLDGENLWQVLWQVMLPFARPALVTLFLFTFIGE